jgi:hypothetical protein
MGLQAMSDHPGLHLVYCLDEDVVFCGAAARLGNTATTDADASVRSRPVAGSGKAEPVRGCPRVSRRGTARISSRNSL